ncbi:MAG: hypothetical protein AB4911_00040 [Oscillochloridaceae bacterium umkhey_bin13]
MPPTLRDESRELEVLISQLADHTNERAPTSPGEATVAAFANGRLRRAGLGVGTYELRVTPRPGLIYAALGLLGLVSALLTGLAPVVALLLALNLLIFLLADRFATPIPSLGRRRSSQNIVATRAIEGAAGLAPTTPRWRLVLLAPLDRGLIQPGLACLAGRSSRAFGLRLLSASLLISGALGALLSVEWWWLATLGGGLGSSLLLGTIWLAPQPQPQDGNLAALAAVIAAAERLSHLVKVELWVVAVGASSSDPRGVSSLLSRFPFDREQTLFLAFEQLSGRQLAYLTHEGAGGHADPQLANLVAQARQHDPLANAQAQRQSQPSSLAAPLRRHGYRTLTLCGSGTAVPSVANEPLEAALVDAATRLITAIVHQLEALPE